MITIHFTQCDKSFEQDELSKEAALMPVHPRMMFYEDVLMDAETSHLDIDRENHEFFTLDENFLLVAQYLKRRGTLRNVVFVSHCRHNRDPITIPLDNEGDMPENPHHGFFSQRLRYLR